MLLCYEYQNLALETHMYPGKRLFSYDRHTFSEAVACIWIGVCMTAAVRVSACQAYVLTRANRGHRWWESPYSCYWWLIFTCRRHACCFKCSCRQVSQCYFTLTFYRLDPSIANKLLLVKHWKKLKPRLNHFAKEFSFGVRGRCSVCKHMAVVQERMINLQEMIIQRGKVRILLCSAQRLSVLHVDR